MNEKVSLLKKIWINLHNENPWKTSKWKKGERVPLTKAAVPCFPLLNDSSKEWMKKSACSRKSELIYITKTPEKPASGKKGNVYP